MTDLLALSNIHVSIGDVEPLAGVDLHIEEGTCLGIVGETGSGKSMTCRVITGLLGRLGGRVTQGSATFIGRDLIAMSERERRALRGREIGFVPQASLGSLDPIMRVGKQITETGRTLGWSPESATERGHELLRQVRLDNPEQVFRLYPHELSGGMRQRVMIALALIGSPRLLVLDEATTALDVTVQQEILDLLAEVRAQYKMSILLVSHDLGVVESIAERVVIMYSGRVVEVGETAAVLAKPSHPYTQALLDARPENSKAGELLAAIEGVPPSLANRPPGCSFSPRCLAVMPTCREKVPPMVPTRTGSEAACWLRVPGEA
jgi:peptide/nickel transport system ATP-binding protein